MAGVLSNFNEANKRLINEEKIFHNTKKEIVRSAFIKKKKEALELAPEMMSLITVTPPDIKNIKQSLPHSENLIEYFGYKDKLFAFVMNENGINAIPIDGQGLDDNIISFRKLIDSGAHVGELKSQGEALYNEQG